MRYTIGDVLDSEALAILDAKRDAIRLSDADVMTLIDRALDADQDTLDKWEADAA